MEWARSNRKGSQWGANIFHACGLAGLCIRTCELRSPGADPDRQLPRILEVEREYTIGSMDPIEKQALAYVEAWVGIARL